MSHTEKGKNLYSVLIPVFAIFTFITIILTYVIIDIKFKNLDLGNDNISKIENVLKNLDLGDNSSEKIEKILENINFGNDSEKLNKILNLQYAQIGGEDNYATVLKIAELTKDKTKKQMEDYLAQLEGGTVPTQPSAPTPSGSISMEDLASIKSLSYIDGNPEADITWLEYSDLECPFCARLHNNGTVESVKSKYGDKVNIIFNHFPLDFHANALPGAQVLECAGELAGTDEFYSIMSASYKSQNSTMGFLVDKAIELGIDRKSLETCINSGRYAEKVMAQMSTGTQKFGVTGTPGNVIINNKTGKYTVLSGALPYSSFEAAIDELLK